MNRHGDWRARWVSPWLWLDRSRSIPSIATTILIFLYYNCLMCLFIIWARLNNCLFKNAEIFNYFFPHSKINLWTVRQRCASSTCRKKRIKNFVRSSSFSIATTDFCEFASFFNFTIFICFKTFSLIKFGIISSYRNGNNGTNGSWITNKPVLP